MSELLCERIRRLRHERHFTAETLGKRCGVSGVSIQYWESGRNMPLTERLNALARALGVSTDFLLTGREAPRLAALQQAIIAGAPRDRLLAMARGES